MVLMTSCADTASNQILHNLATWWYLVKEPAPRSTAPKSVPGSRMHETMPHSPSATSCAKEPSRCTAHKQHHPSSASDMEAWRITWMGVAIFEWHPRLRKLKRWHWQVKQLQYLLGEAHNRGNIKAHLIQPVSTPVRVSCHEESSTSAQPKRAPESRAP